MKPLKLNGWVRLGLVLSTFWFIAMLVALLTTTFFGLTHWLFDWVDAGTPESPVAGLIWGRFLGLLLLPILTIWLLGACWAWVQKGFLDVRGTRYVTGDRLADVLALIQVLALDQHPHRSDEGLAKELQGSPKSAESWRSIAREHPEFFRVSTVGVHQLSLLARHVAPRDGEEILPSGYASQLMQLAVELHDRQLRRVQAWHVLIPVLVAVIAGSISLVGIALK